MEKGSPKKTLTRKRKKKTVSPLETKSLKLEESTKLVAPVKRSAGPQKTELSPVKFDGLTMDEIGDRYPVLKNVGLVQKFLNVSMTNNQKGRIRQLLRDNLKGISDTVLPEVIHSRIQAVLNSSEHLTDADLRKIRILYNMLKTSLNAEHSAKKRTEKNAGEKLAEKVGEKKEEKKKLVKGTKKASTEKTDKPEASEAKKEPAVKKVKGKKRYVVFIGNLPLGVDKDQIMKHFWELSDHIVDIRIPKAKQDKKSSIAYVELRNEPTYELALSKHHSMLGNKRINVLYTTQQKSKVSKTEAKSKSAKLVALQKSGKLIGSTALVKKRSHRRAKLKQARAKETA